jgi:hypothetical protein
VRQNARAHAALRNEHMFVYIADLALDRRPRDRQIDLALSLWCPAILTLHETYRMSTTRTNVAEAAPKDILQDERLKLWVCSGGRCAICNAYLLADEFTGHYVNLAEMAHNVGRQRASGSPRGTDELAIQERNKAENLLLLCRKDHKVIDHPDTRAEWPVERLREIKRTTRTASTTSQGSARTPRPSCCEPSAPSGEVRPSRSQRRPSAGLCALPRATRGMSSAHGAGPTSSSTSQRSQARASRPTGRSPSR